MNRYIFLFLIAAFSLLLHAKCVAQNNIVYGAGISYTNGAPTFVPPAKSARVAIDTVTSKWYEYATPGGWRWSGDRVTDISGCSAPAYTPGKAQSRLVLNSCTAAQNGHGPEMYKYTGTEWLCLNCVTGGGGVYTGGEGIVVDSPSIRIDTLDRLSFATSPTLPGGVGTIRWNDTDGTLEFGMKGGNVTQQIGQEQLILVKHADNSGLANGNVVYVVGSDGANKTVRLARADAESTSANTFGVMTEAATGGNKAFCTTFGLVRDINTSALTEGAMVWLSAATAGVMTTTRPTAPNHAVQIGFCIRSHATQGVIFVSVQNGYELDELHNVTITSPANNQILQYNSAGQSWVNATLSAITGSIANGQVAFGSGTAITGSNSFFWDAINNRLGINTISPAQSLHTAGNGYISGVLGVGTSINNSYGIRVRAPTSTGWALVMVDNSNAWIGGFEYNGRFTFSNQYHTIGASNSGAWALGGREMIFTNDAATTSDVAYRFSAINGPGTLFRLGGTVTRNNNSSSYTAILFQSVINQTGTSIGTINGIVYNPTITSLQGNHYAAVFSSGQVGIGTLSPVNGAQLEVKSTTGVMVPPNMTSTQRDAIASPPNGIIYNTTTGKFQGYAAGSWVDLH